MKNILFIIDDLEFKYFEFNKLVTNFWLIKEYLNRGHRVDVTLKNKLYQKRNVPFAQCFESYIDGIEIKKKDKSFEKCLNEYNTIFFRPDPPVDIDYINASYILSYVDSNSTFIINSPQAIRDKNEKLYVNEFQDLIPDNIVASDEKVIKEFLFEKKEIIIKPTNRCFGSGVFYLNSTDKNINAILQTATNNYKTTVMIQEYLPKVQDGDKRLIYICGKIFDHCVKKVATNNDFKFNEHNGIYTAGLDVIDGKIIEINITSPCFFINEINNIFSIEFEKMITDRIELYSNSRQQAFIDKLSIC